MIPFILHFEASTRLERHSEGDEQRCRKLFGWARRQGWSEDPSDRGGATMCGVTLATFRNYCRCKGLPVPTKRDLRDITFDVWSDIFKSIFWDTWQADRISSQKVAEMLVDWVWSSGMAGIRIPQRMLGVKADGIVGTATLAAVEGREADAFTEELRTARLNHIDALTARDPRQRKFRRGWRRRVLACY